MQRPAVEVPPPEPLPAGTQLSLFDAVAAPADCSLHTPAPADSAQHAAAPADGAQQGAAPANGARHAAAPADAAQQAAAALSAVAPLPAFHHPAAQREIELDGHRIGYALRRSRRRSIGFVVGADGLSVAAPRWVGPGDIESALRAKSRWILNKLREQRERARRLEAARFDWRDGTTIPFMGAPVVVVLDPRVTGALLGGGAPALPGLASRTLHVGLPQTAAAAQIRDAVQGWLQRQARRIFEERCALYAERLGVRMRRLSLSSAATRWGSASADGSIRLNWRLVHFTLPVIDYVVTHELAHLREMNHGAAFWEVVRSALPDYETARGALRQELPVSG